MTQGGSLPEQIYGLRSASARLHFVLHFKIQAQAQYTMVCASIRQTLLTAALSILRH